MFGFRSPDEVIRKAFRLWRREGIRGLQRAVFEVFLGGMPYSRWISFCDVLSPADRELIRADIARFSHCPGVSLLMPLGMDSSECLKRTIASLSAQLYPHWELCIAVDPTMRLQVGAMVEDARKTEPRISVLYPAETQTGTGTLNQALETLTGEFVALLDMGDELSEHALYLVAEALTRDPDLDLIYGDMDRIDAEGRRHDPYFKPAWNPDLMLGQDLTRHLGVFRSDLVRSLGGFREGLEGTQHWDLALRVEEHTDETRIRHVPHVLYHAHVLSSPVSQDEDDDKRGHVANLVERVLTDCCMRRGIAARAECASMGRFHIVYPIPDPPPIVSVVIPTYNALRLLRGCLDGLFHNTDYPAKEIIVVDNRSDDPATLAYLDDLAAGGRIRLLRHDAPFNYSAINNTAVRRAKGELICLLNNDIEPIGSNWLGEMVGHALRPEIGAVGAMLYYPDDKIQHAGVFLNGYGADHLYKGAARGISGDSGRARLVQNVSAVTAACLVVRKRIWDEVGGLDERQLAVAFNDVDFCLKVRQRGYRNLWTPFAELYHHESVTRGRDDTPEKRARFDSEVACLRARWAHVLNVDPALSPNHAFSNPPQRLAYPPRVAKPWLEGP